MAAGAARAADTHDEGELSVRRGSCKVFRALGSQDDMAAMFSDAAMW